MLLALLLASSPFPVAVPRGCRDRSCARARVATQPDPYAFFEFAPPSSAGMTAPCACSAVTGARGESMTFTRASDATCLKGGTTSGIVPGDMVSCSTNQPRVERAVNGTGQLMLLRENAGTNTTWRSESFDNTSLWKTVDAGTGVAIPIVTANQAASPDGGLQMDRIQSAATDGGSLSLLAEVGACTTGKLVAASVFVEGVGDAGTTDLCIQTASMPTYVCAACSFPSVGTISRCKLPSVTTTDTGTFILGNASGYNGGITRAASDFYAWGAQCEASIGAVTSYMPAVGNADGTRALEVADFPLALSGLTQFSMGAQLEPDSLAFTAGATAIPMVLGNGTVGSTSAPSTYVWIYSSVTAGRVAVDTLNVMDSGFTTWDPFYSAFDGGQPGAVPMPLQASAFETGQFLGACQEGICAAASGNPGISAVLGSPVFTRLILGREGSTAATGYNGLIGSVCVDQTQGRCTPQPPTGPVLWIGDSIIYGTGNIPQTPYVQLSRLIGKGVQGAGVGGNTASQCASRWDTSLRHGPYTTVVWSCAINSIAGGATGAATATTVQAALAEAIADGQKVIVTGVMPWDGSAGWSSGKNAEGLDYNSRMSAWAVDAGATYVSTDSMGSGSPLTLLAGYDSGDAIHPNVAGAGALAALVQAASP